MDDFLLELCGSKLTDEQIRMMNPLKLAYIGDVVFELFIRTYVINVEKGNVNLLNKKSVKFVNAKSQSKIARNLEGILTEEEWTILKRGRNQKSLSPPKNSSIGDYKYATGLESLIGYLYLSGRKDRVKDIMLYAIKYINNDYKEL